MQNRYTGDIGDFGKFLLLKHLFPNEKITTIWYLYPDESHNTDGSHTVEEGNAPLYRHCHTIDPQMAELFNTIHSRPKRHAGLFEELGILDNGSYFGEGIIGEGGDYRNRWSKRAMAFIQECGSSVICLDPDNGIEPSTMAKLSPLKQGKYAILEEIDAFFTLDRVEHVVIYQHFNRLKKHDAQMAEAKKRFESLYEGRAAVTLIRHNPVQARYYIVLSKSPLPEEKLMKLNLLEYGDKPFFSLYV